MAVSTNAEANIISKTLHIFITRFRRGESHLICDMGTWADMD